MQLSTIFRFIQKTYTSQTKKSSGDIEWLLEETENNILIGYRGSEFYGNKWLADLLRNLFASVPWYSFKLSMWVSLGYYCGALRSIRQVSETIPNKKPLIVCGHSMGAAVSYFASLLLSQKGYQVYAWIGIGSANCKITRSKQITFKTLNYKYEEDIVSKYPFRLLGFKQPSRIIHIGTDDSTTIKPGNVNDHLVTKYVNNCPDINI